MRRAGSEQVLEDWVQVLPCFDSLYPFLESRGAGDRKSSDHSLISHLQLVAKVLAGT